MSAPDDQPAADAPPSAPAPIRALHLARFAADGARPVSPAAFRLHVCAVLASIEADRSGSITDGYLDSVQAEVDPIVCELCAAGLWTPVDGGYEVAAGEVMRMAGEVHRQMQDLAAQCRRGGGHEPDDELAGVCRRCAVRL